MNLATLTLKSKFSSFNEQNILCCVTYFGTKEKKKKTKNSVTLSSNTKQEFYFLTDNIKIFYC